MPAVAEIALHLTLRTRKRAYFIWGPEQQTAFQKHKDCLMSPPILGFPLESEGSFVIDKDASGHTIGSIISQFQDNKERVIAYGSHTLNTA